MGSFQDFIGGPEDKSKTGYQDFSQKIWNVSSSSQTVSADAQSIVAPAEQTQGLATGLSETMAQLGTLTEKLGSAMKGSKAAITSLKDEFKVKNQVQKVELPKEFLDYYAKKQGLEAKDINLKTLSFGAQTINSDMQYEKLERQVSTLKTQYSEFKNAEVHLLDYGNGKQVAVVMNVDANAYNSINAAERKKSELEQTVKQSLKTAPKKEQTQTVTMNAMTDKIAELEKKYPSQNKPPEQELVHNDLPKVQRELPNVQKPGVREVA